MQGKGSGEVKNLHLFTPTAGPQSNAKNRKIKNLLLKQKMDKEQTVLNKLVGEVGER